MKKQTLAKECNLSGIGIHSGKENHIRFIPSTKGHIEFSHKKHNSPALVVHPSNIAKNNNRATILEGEHFNIITPEHLLSACAGLGIDSLSIEVSEDEIPILDGSSKTFVDLFLQGGLEAIDEKKECIIIKEPIICEESDRKLIVLPAQSTTFSYYLHYPNHFIFSQSYSIDLSKGGYIHDIAPARTYGFEHEIQALIDKGLAKGGSIDNAVIIGDDDYKNKLRFDNECVRHKILDMIGDFWILNKDIKGHIIGIKSGHQMNTDCVKEIYQRLQT